MTHFLTDGWPVLTAYHAACALYKGEVDTVVIDGPAKELDVVCMALNWTSKVTVDSFIGSDLAMHLLVEAA